MFKRNNSLCDPYYILKTVFVEVYVCLVEDLSIAMFDRRDVTLTAEVNCQEQQEE